MYSNDEWRQALGRPGMTDAEIEEFRADLDVFLSKFLDEYLREEFQED